MSTTSITQDDIDSLEAALASGELQVRKGDRWITYRSVDELKKALSYARDQLSNSSGQRRSRVYAGSLCRDL